MRIISGKAKGRRLKAPKLSKGRRLRPLGGRAKEALFNILGSKVVDANFLDLFAGTGAVGIEALSRGARVAFFVERDRKTVETIRENLKTADLYEAAEIYGLDVRRAIKLLNSKGAKFDIIFMGAPYDSPLLEESLKRLSETSLLRPEGVVIAEHRNKQVLAENFNNLSKFRDARYGDTILSFYRTSPLHPSP